MTNNPWKEIGYGTQRRAAIDRNIFWIKEERGDYGICIEINNEKDTKLSDIDLKDIEVIKNKHELRNILQWYLILRNKEEWQIFKVLCDDLIVASSDAKTEKAMITIMESRLKRWQNLLKKRRNLDFPIEKQMGLYSELYFLKNVIANKIGIMRAIDCWVGPDADKQDFLLDNCAIEIKSYSTSKGEKVEITSKEQLQTEKENLFLITCALTKSDNGFSIAEIVEEIQDELIINGEYSKVDLLEFKLMEYGYLPIIHKQEFLTSFIIDKMKAYHVRNRFPRITSGSVPSQIATVRYQIDLSVCQEWEIDIEKLNV